MLYGGKAEFEHSVVDVFIHFEQLDVIFPSSVLHLALEQCRTFQNSIECHVAPLVAYMGASTRFLLMSASCDRRVKPAVTKKAQRRGRGKSVRHSS